MGLRDPLARVRRSIGVPFLLGPFRPRVSSPGGAQLAATETMDELGFFGDAVAQNLTGLPSTSFKGYTEPAQRLVQYPAIDVSADPGIAVADRVAFPQPRVGHGVPGGVPAAGGVPEELPGEPPAAGDEGGF